MFMKLSVNLFSRVSIYLVMDTPQLRQTITEKTIAYGRKNALIINGKEYAFTQTFNPKTGIPEHVLIKQYEKGLQLIVKFLKDCSDVYTLYPEMHASGQIHFHGFVKIKDRFNYYKNLCRYQAEVGFITMVDIDDPIKWLEYCNKDVSLMQELIPDYPIPINREQSMLVNRYLQYKKKYIKVNNVIKQCKEGSKLNTLVYWIHNNEPKLCPCKTHDINPVLLRAVSPAL